MEDPATARWFITVLATLRSALHGEDAMQTRKPSRAARDHHRSVGGSGYDAVVQANVHAETVPRVLITDLDNTLWDWFAAWHESFVGMLDRLSELSDVPRDVLETEIRAVHQLRGTSEYSNLLNELPSLSARDSDFTPLEIYDDAVHVLNHIRKKATSLYPLVKETLERLRNHGVTVVAYTESVAYWAEWRIKHTGPMV